MLTRDGFPILWWEIQSISKTEEEGVVCVEEVIQTLGDPKIQPFLYSIFTPDESFDPVCSLCKMEYGAVVQDDGICLYCHSFKGASDEQEADKSFAN